MTRTVLFVMALWVGVPLLAVVFDMGQWVPLVALIPALYAVLTVGLLAIFLWVVAQALFEKMRAKWRR